MRIGLAFGDARKQRDLAGITDLMLAPIGDAAEQQRTLDFLSTVAR